MAPRRFPPPWIAEETDACFIIRDHSGYALAYVYSGKAFQRVNFCMRSSNSFKRPSRLANSDLRALTSEIVASSRLAAVLVTRFPSASAVTICTGPLIAARLAGDIIPGML
jgi:hypothetical protein